MNYCNKCGNKIEPNSKFCNKCGNKLQYHQINNNYQSNYINGTNSNSNNIKKIVIGISIGITGIMLFLICSMVIKEFDNKYYFDANSYKTGEIENQTQDVSTPKRGKYSTAIIYDNIYDNVPLSSDKDAKMLIEEDSVSQKINCPSEIRQIEDNIINKYGITAVNLCEINLDLAREIDNVIGKIYDEYPVARGYMTNLSLVNIPMNGEYIAAFMPMFNFATSDSSSTYPWVYKTQLLLNSSYFLNTERLEASVKDGSSSGHFPPNATRYSPVAHELGHYLSFLALMKHHNLESLLLIEEEDMTTFYKIDASFRNNDFSLEMINEAYENYKRDTNTTLSMDEWRGTISNYALAKDNSGDYIYDETIAESFHDIYLNGDKAKDASKYIIEILKRRLEE